MHSFSYGGRDLLQFGGRITQKPVHTVARRNVTRVKIYGKSGDEVIDNGSYDNVDFSVKVCFLPHLMGRRADELARAVIDWLAPLQGGYHEYRDTLNNGYFTQAVLTNFAQIERELRTLMTATLKFTRVPFWYSDSGTVPVAFLNRGVDNILINPEAYPSEPVYRFHHGGSGNAGVTVGITVNGTTRTAQNLPYRDTNYYFDNVAGQYYCYIAGNKEYLGTVMLPDLIPGTNILRFYVSTVEQDASYSLEVIPNWRRL